MGQRPLTRMQPSRALVWARGSSGIPQGPEVMVREPRQGSRALGQAWRCLGQAWGPGQDKTVPADSGGGFSEASSGGGQSRNVGLVSPHGVLTQEHRIIEPFELEGTFKGHLVQPSTSLEAPRFRSYILLLITLQ